MNDLLIISCIFGKKFKYVHPSPDNKNSYFFTDGRYILQAKKEQLFIMELT